MYIPSRAEFTELSSRGKTIPVFRELQADTLTPVVAFLALDDKKSSFLLESAGGSEQWGRYSFVGSRPHAVVTVRDSHLSVRFANGVTHSRTVSDPAAELVAFLREQQPVSNPNLPRFSGGLVGFLSYDAARWFESLPEVPKNSTELIDAGFLLTDLVCIFDSCRQSVKIVVHARIGEEHGSADEAYDAACQRIDATVHRLFSCAPPSAPIDRPALDTPPCTIAAESLSRSEFCAAVETAKNYIYAGDVIQVVLSRRFETPVLHVDPFDVYRMLRTLNPSPYLFFIRLSDYCISGSSPELLVRLTHDRIEVRPIAGTRKRGKDPVDDKNAEDDLRNDPKEIAEHVMLLDLGRNDVGRVSKPGSVRVEDKMVVERYSHVMHLVSGVAGTIDSRYGPADVIRATFPAGTLTGAPKVRAMELIEELEPIRRGTYGGAVGYIDFSENVDLCIAIRSFLYQNGKFVVQAGAGIVADSVPELECDETEAKATAVLRAIAMAQRLPSKDNL